MPSYMVTMNAAGLPPEGGPYDIERTEYVDGLVASGVLLLVNDASAPADPAPAAAPSPLSGDASVSRVEPVATSPKGRSRPAGHASG